MMIFMRLFILKNRFYPNIFTYYLLPYLSVETSIAQNKMNVCDHRLIYFIGNNLLQKIACSYAA
jgi:hypothetical protein